MKKFDLEKFLELKQFREFDREFDSIQSDTTNRNFFPWRLGAKDRQKFFKSCSVYNLKELLALGGKNLKLKIFFRLVKDENGRVVK